VIISAADGRKENTKTRRFDVHVYIEVGCERYFGINYSFSAVVTSVMKGCI